MIYFTIIFLWKCQEKLGVEIMVYSIIIIIITYIYIHIYINKDIKYHYFSNNEGNM